MLAALDRDAAAVRLGDRLDDRETEADAGFRLCALAAEETFEHMPLVVGRDAHPGIGDLEHDSAPSPGYANVDRASRGGELERVREQVLEQLGDPGRVDAGAQGFFGEDPDADAGFSGPGEEGVNRLASELGQVGVCEVEVELARFRTRDDEHVVDEGKQPVGAAADRREVALLFGAQRAGGLLVPQQLEVADHRCQGCTEVVGDDGEKLVLQLVRFLQHHVLLFHQLRRALPFGFCCLAVADVTERDQVSAHGRLVDEVLAGCLQPTPGSVGVTHAVVDLTDRSRCFALGGNGSRKGRNVVGVQPGDHCRADELLRPPAEDALDGRVRVSDHTVGVGDDDQVDRVLDQRLKTLGAEPQVRGVGARP